MNMRIESFKGVYIRARHTKWHRSVLAVHDRPNGLTHSDPIAECGARVYSPWGIQQTNNIEGRELCSRCRKKEN